MEMKINLGANRHNLSMDTVALTNLNVEGRAAGKKKVTRFKRRIVARLTSQRG